MERRVTARLAIIGAATTLVFPVLVVALQVIQRRDYHPVRQAMSELALGRDGWLMAIAFCSLAVGSALLARLMYQLTGSRPATILLGAAAALSAVIRVCPCRRGHREDDAARPDSPRCGRPHLRLDHRRDVHAGTTTPPAAAVEAPRDRHPNHRDRRNPGVLPRTRPRPSPPRSGATSAGGAPGRLERVRPGLCAPHADQSRRPTGSGAGHRGVTRGRAWLTSWRIPGWLGRTGTAGGLHGARRRWQPSEQSRRWRYSGRNTAPISLPPRRTSVPGRRTARGSPALSG